MEEAVTCTVCSEVYQKGPREPLVLPCGHTFCRTCVNNVVKTGNFLCPTCRSQHLNVVVDNLLINFSLLSLSSTFKDFLCDSCSKHGDELKYWCRECKVPLCSLCLYSEHENGHHVHLAKAYIQERKSQLKDHIKVIIDKNIDEKKEEIRHIFYNICRKIRTPCQISTFVHDFEEDMKLLSSEIEKVCSIDSLFVSEAKVQSIEMDKLNSLLSGNDSTEAEVTRECAASADAAEGKTEVVTAEEGKTEAAEAVTQQQQQAPPGTHQTVISHRAKLDCRDGRLLLHSLTKHVDTHLSLQLPSEVFLVLGVGGRCLGRVYIRMQPHLRHSQQFLLLCLGTLGPSFVGSSISSVEGVDQVTENIAVNSYIDKSQIHNTNLIASLESSCDIVGSATEGTVTSTDMGSNVFGFMIWTKGHPFNNCPYRTNNYMHHPYIQNNSTCNVHFPFGEVLSGMEVVLAAIGHNPINEVTITDCGLVIPDLTP